MNDIEKELLNYINLTLLSRGVSSDISVNDLTKHTVQNLVKSLAYILETVVEHSDKEFEERITGGFNYHEEE